MIAKFECQIAKYMLASFLKAVAVLTVFSHSRLYLGMPNVILLTSVELEAKWEITERWWHETAPGSPEASTTLSEFPHMVF